jgi:hypothetical protein
MHNITQSTNAPQTYRGQLINSSASALGYPVAPTIDFVSNLRYWQFSTSGPNTVNTQMTFYYNSYDQVTDYTKLTIAGTGAGGSYWNDLNGTPTANVAGNVTATIPVTSFGDFALANLINGSNPLPVTLLNFKATEKNQTQVFLQWTTSNEINNDYFAIEVSADGKIFHEAGRVNGAGNSTSIINYTFIDFAPLNGISYYRLKQTDKNGKTEYSSIVSVTINNGMNTNNDKGFVILSNPTDADNIFVRFTESNTEQWEFQLIDNYGRILGIQSLNSSGNDSQMKPLEQLAGGMYTLIGITRNQQHTEKLIIK